MTSDVGSITWSGPEDGPLVVLVHGAMDRAAGLAKVARRLDDHARVLRYDRRGYGRAAHHPGPFTIEANVDDLLGLIEDRPAVLVGHSLGGDVVLAAAARRPDLALGVVAFEPPMPWAEWWPKDSASSQAAETVGTSAERDAALAERFMIRLIGQRRWDGLPERTRATRREEGRALVAELRDLRNPPWLPAQIMVPTIVGVSEHARPHHRRATAEIAEAIAGARLVEVPNCHHDAHSSVPGPFAELLVEPLLSSR